MVLQQESTEHKILYIQQQTLIYFLYRMEIVTLGQLYLLFLYTIQMGCNKIQRVHHERSQQTVIIPRTMSLITHQPPSYMHMYILIKYWNYSTSHYSVLAQVLCMKESMYNPRFNSCALHLLSQMFFDVTQLDVVSTLKCISLVRFQMR